MPYSNVWFYNDIRNILVTVVYEIGVKLESNSEQNISHTKSLQILCRKRITGLKGSYLACKCVFYRPEHNAKGRPRGTEFWRSWNAKLKYTNR